MNHIELLIQKHCPNGVEFRALGELREFFSGLNGKTKMDFADGNARYISYMNVFSNLATNLNLNDCVKISPKEKQNTIEFGDILFTGSSETPLECGMSSVITSKVKESIYLNSFCFGFRFNDKSLFLPDFCKYLFRDDKVRKQIVKCVNGVTRFNISRKKFESIQIPIPPLEIQKEIVKILDSFTELEKELEARRKQYEYYREKLLSFESLVNRAGGGQFVKMMRLGEVAFYPKERIQAQFLNAQNYIGVENLLQNKQGKIDSISVPKSGNSIHYKVYDCLIGNIRPYLKKIWFSNNEGGTNGDVLLIRVKDEFKENLQVKFLYHNLASDNFFTYHNNSAKGAKMPRGDKKAVLNFQIPIPPLKVQNEIVEILDRFDALVNDITSGIPAEINARKKQYEYYRE